jgi:5-methylcytosine-specific restriction endonuclease McrA
VSDVARRSGGQPGHSVSEATRAKISEAKRGVKLGPLSPEHRANIAAGQRGKVRSLETRAKISAANMTRSPESRAVSVAAMRAANIGRPRPPEVREKIAAGHRGKKLTAEHVEKMATAKRGRILSPEHRAKIGAGNRGKVFTDERRGRISAALRGNKNTRTARVIGVCVYCGDPATTWDHVIPRRRGGTDDPGNLVPACKPCNSSKCDLLLSEWSGRRRT